MNLAQTSKPGKRNQVRIENNEITDPRIGIIVNNLPNTQVLENTVIFNDIFFNDSLFGIRNISCDVARISNNKVSYTNSSASLTGVLRGINIEASKNAMVDHNIINDAVNGMYIKNNCSATQLRCNEFNRVSGIDKMVLGVELDNVTMSDQGAVNYPGENEWNGLTSNYYVDGTGNPFNWFYDVCCANYNPKSNPNIVTDIPTGTVLSFPFPCSNGSEDTGGEKRNARMNAIVNDTATFEQYQLENSYTDKATVYAMMQLNDSLITQGNADDAAYQQFYADMQQSNIEYNKQIDSLAASNNIADAYYYNDAINDTNLYERNLKVFNEIYLRTIAVGVDLNTSDSLALEEIAYQNAITGGPAVYYGRAALFLEIYEQSDAMRVMNHASADKVKVADVSTIKVLPNPTKNSINITGLDETIKNAEIFDVHGKKVMTIGHTKLQQTIDISQLCNGMYHIVLYSDNSKQGVSFGIIH